jgi:hypothetical protein
LPKLSDPGLQVLLPLLCGILILGEALFNLYHTLLTDPHYPIILLVQPLNL